MRKTKNSGPYLEAVDDPNFEYATQCIQDFLDNSPYARYATEFNTHDGSKNADQYGHYYYPSFYVYFHNLDHPSQKFIGSIDYGSGRFSYNVNGAPLDVSQWSTLEKSVSGYALMADILEDFKNYL